MTVHVCEYCGKFFNSSVLDECPFCGAKSSVRHESVKTLLIQKEA